MPAPSGAPPSEALVGRDELPAGLEAEQAALRQIATLVAQQSSPDEVFTAVAEAVGPLLGADLTAMHAFGEGGAATTIAGWSAEGPMLPMGTRLRLDTDSVAARIFRTAAPARIDSYFGISGETAQVARALGLRSTVGAPIIVEGKLWGALMAATRGAEPLPEATEARLAAFTELVAAAIANVEARSTLERVAKEQEALRTAATLVASGAAPAEVFAQITAAASDVFHAPFASVIRFTTDSRATMVAGCPACSAYVGMAWEVPDDDPGITRAVVVTGKPARIEDHARVAGPVGEAARALGVGSVVGAPVVVDGAVWGVLVVGASQDGPPLAADVGARLTAFTELVTTTLINAEAREEVRSLLSEQERLRRVATVIAQGASLDDVFVAVCDEAAELFGSEMAAIGRLDDEPGLVTVGLSAGVRGMTLGMRTELADWLASSAVYRTGLTARKEVTAKDVTSPGPIADAVRAMGFLSTVAAPIMVEGRLWGVMTVSDSRHSLPSDTEKRIENFTELLATAIANREARDTVTELFDEQSALRRVATLVASGATQSEVFAAVSEEVQRVFLKVDSTVVADVIKFEAHEFVLVGTSSGTEAVPLGSRWGPNDLYASTGVLRTERSARVGESDLASIGGPDAEYLRSLGYLSQIASPILVEGRPWGVITMNAAQTLPPDTEERLEKFTELVATAIANTESRADTARLADEQSALRRVATLVASGVTPSEVFSAVAQEVADLFGVEGITMQRFEPDGSSIQVGVGGEINPYPVGTHFERHPGSIESMRKTGRPARADSYAEVPGQVAATLFAAGVRSSIAAPVVVDNKIWGAIAILSASHEPLPRGAEERLASFTELVGTAIANSQAGERVAELADEQAALRRVATLVAERPNSEELFSTVAREVAGVLDVSGVLVERFAEEDVITLGVAYDADLEGADAFFGVGMVMPRDAGSLAAQVFETRRAARIDDYSRLPGMIGDAARAAGLGSGVAGPIVVDGALWGQMCVFSRAGSELPVGTEDRLGDFIELVATAISNHEAHGALQRLADEQAALRRIATQVAEGATPDRVFDAVRNEVVKMFGSLLAILMRYESDGTATLLATVDDYPGPIGSRWPLEGDTSSPATVFRTGRPARVDYGKPMQGSLSEAGRREAVRWAVGVPVMVEGALWGVMSVGFRDEETPRADVEERLEKFTELLATAIANADSRAELAASRARVIAAADGARRQIERDLHDGAQQQLVTLSVALSRAEAKIPPDLDEIRAEVSRVGDGLASAVDELREMSRGIHPAILTQGGLLPAIKALGRRAAVAVELDVSYEQRLPEQVEVAAYYVISEALTNASKHAQASRVVVSLRVVEDRLLLTICDDGVGGADQSRGSGLIGLRDRVEALGGNIDVDSPAGGGTQINVEIPVSGDQSSGARP